MPRPKNPLVTLLAVTILGACSSGPSPTPEETPQEQSASITRRAPAEEAGPRQVEIPIAEDAVIWAEAHGAPDAPRTLVVLHGGPGLSHHYTRPLLELVSEKLQVIVFDQRGVGASTPMESSRHTLSRQVADLEALRAHFELEQMIVLGHSWGGLIGMAHAASHPERVDALVLVDSAPPDTNTLLRTFDAFDRRVATRIEQGHVPTPLPPVEGGDCAANLVALLPVYFHDPEHEDTTHLGGSSCHASVLEATQRNSAGFDHRQALGQLRSPSVIFHGASDPFGLEGVEVAARALEGSLKGRVILERCGHIPWEECPEPFFTELERFLDAPGSYAAP